LELGSSSNDTSDLSIAATAIASRFAVTSRYIEQLRKLVDQRALFYNEPGAAIDDCSALFNREDEQTEHELKLLASWLEQNSARSSQRRRHGDIVLSSLKSRRAEYALTFNDLLKKRTEVLKSKVRRQTQFGAGSAFRRRELSLGTPLFTYPTPNQQQTGSKRTDTNPATTSGAPPVQHLHTSGMAQNNPSGDEPSTESVGLVRRRPPRGGKVMRPTCQKCTVRVVCLILAFFNVSTRSNDVPSNGGRN